MVFLYITYFVIIIVIIIIIIISSSSSSSSSASSIYSNWMSYADVSEHSVYSIFISGYVWRMTSHPSYLCAYEDGTVFRNVDI